MQIKRARADIEVFDLKTAYLGRSPTCSYARRMSRWSRRLAAATYTVRRAQRTHGTTDPGGVWHPVHRRECLTILLGTYAENGQINRHGRRTALYSVQPAYACIGSRLRCRSDARSTIALESTGALFHGTY